jgi:hypothetical protein
MRDRQGLTLNEAEIKKDALKLREQVVKSLEVSADKR